jgi:AraC-like DNA-binding protein
MIKDLIAYTPMYVTFFWALVLLLSKREKNRARFFLGVFMSAAFLVYLSHAVFFKKEISTYQHIDSVYIFAMLSVYPLYYWYIKLLTIETEMRRYNLRMFLPAFILAFGSFVLYRLMTEDDRIIFIDRFFVHGDLKMPDSAVMQIQKWVILASRLVFAIQVLFFLVHGRKLVIRYNKRIANFYSNLESKTIVWVKFLLYSFVATSAMSMIFNFIGRGVFIESTFLLLIPSFIFSLLLFLIGLQGYMQNHTVIDLERDEGGSHQEEHKKYNSEQLRDKLVELFAFQHIYLQPELKITEVTKLLATNRSYVSSLINTEFSCSFSEFVNGYRIIEAKRFLNDRTKAHFSLNYISETVGFGSIGTFIRVFRESEGVTPGKYRDEVEKRESL